MQYARIDSNYFCGIDLHARTMFVCIMDKMGEIVFQRNLKNDFKLLLQVLETHLSSIAVGVESTFNWYWLADGCHKAGIPFYLGHALYMKAIHGGKKKNDRLDSRMLAELMRCNLFPMAYALPIRKRCGQPGTCSGEDTGLWPYGLSVTPTSRTPSLSRLSWILSAIRSKRRAAGESCANVCPTQIWVCL